MAMKSVLVVLGVLLFPPSGVLAQPATSAEPPDVPADIEEWMRTAWGMEPQVLGVTDTHFLSSLSASERQGAFLFKQRCNTCHYSTMSTTRGAGAGLVDATSYGPPLSRTNVEGEDRERAVRRLISEGSATMPAFRYALRPSRSTRSSATSRESRRSACRWWTGWSSSRRRVWPTGTTPGSCGST